MGKYLDLIGLSYLIEKIQAMFIKKTDTIPATSLAIDTTPTNNSDRLITSGGVKAGLDTKQDTIDSSHKLSADLIQDGTTNKVYTSTEKSKLAGIASGAEVNVQVDWNVTNTSSDAYIKNKPTIPAEQIQADWNLTTTTAKDFIKNKPTIPDDSNLVHITGDETIFQKKTFAANGEIHLVNGWDQIYNDDDSESLLKALNARNNVQADWNQTTTTAKDFIKNKPSIPITDYDIYAANLLVTNSANYITEPEVKSVKINGSSTNSASSSNCVLLYDTTNQCLKFIFN